MTSHKTCFCSRLNWFNKIREEFHVKNRDSWNSTIRQQGLSCTEQPEPKKQQWNFDAVCHYVNKEYGEVQTSLEAIVYWINHTLIEFYNNLDEWLDSSNKLSQIQTSTWWFSLILAQSVPLLAYSMCIWQSVIWVQLYLSLKHRMLAWSRRLNLSWYSTPWQFTGVFYLPTFKVDAASLK